MRKLSLLLALAALPGAASGQYAPDPGPRLEVTPFLGFRIGYGVEQETFVTDGINSVDIFEDTEVDAAPLVGVEVGYRLEGPWSVIGSLAYSGASDATLTTVVDGDRLVDRIRGGSLWFARAGIQFRLPEPDELDDRRLHRPSAFLFAAPALVRFDPVVARSSPGYFGDGYSQPALNLGVKATGRLPWSDRMSFQLVAEDYMTFWNDGVLIDRYTRLFADEGLADAQVELSSGTSNIFVVRAGLTVRI